MDLISPRPIQCGPVAALEISLTDMDSLYRRALTYQADSSVLFDALRDLPYPVFLDSAHPYSDRGRYDILSASPLTIYKINSASYGNKERLFRDVGSLLNELAPLTEEADDLPFAGGIIGVFSYDGGRELEGIERRERDSDKNDQIQYQCPDFFAGLYSWAVIVDHHTRTRCLISHPATPAALLADIEGRIAKKTNSKDLEFSLCSTISTNLDVDGYRTLFDKVQDYIRAGDCYQINLARRFEAQYLGHPWQAYQQLRRLAAAPFSAYLEMPECSILSFSPERFLQVDNREVLTTPIKGTAPRSAIPDNDSALADALLASDKDRAENLMIVDLLRNDIGRCCEPGSIRVEKLFELQSFQTVHHLVSTIRGRLAEDQSPLQLLAACFPGGSITGAPKHRAMDIIEELEPHQRSIYCGSVTYISCHGKMDSNIAIRTLLCEAGKLYCWAGGGIVADSKVELEFEETWNKVGSLLTHLQKMR
ncbi:MAG: para-aminobenzoate synthetase component 1 [Bermanella sp.]